MRKWVFIFLSLRACAATYFVNPATGSDGNSGLTPSIPWQTAGKINGFSFAYGDVLIIDTSAAMLDLSATNLTFSTHGLTVKATNAPYWTNKLWQTLTNAHFTATGPANVFQIPIFNNTGWTQQYVVIWEDDKWLAHPTGSTWSSVSNYVCTNAGSFWTDGATLYVHPLGDTNPNSDGKVYTRSVNRNAGNSAIILTATNIFFADCHAGKTTLARDTDGDGVGAYVLGTMSGLSSGTNNVVTNGYFYYGSKHTVGFTDNADNSELLVIDSTAEQATPYASCSAWVSYMSGATKSNNVHRYVRCRTRKGIGRIGYTDGTNDNQSVLLSHNNGSGVQWSAFYVTDCDFTNGFMALSVATNVYYTGTKMGGITVNSPYCAVNRCWIDTVWVNQLYTGGTLGITNCIFTPNSLTGFGGCHAQGTEAIINCTFDTANVTNADTALGIIFRAAQVNIEFKNNAVLVPSNRAHTVFGAFTSADTIRASNNFYRLGYNAQTAFNYNDGVTTASRTFSQWQALGFDANSVTNPASGLRANYQPTPGAYVNGLGVNIGPMSDFSGTVFSTRTTAGAYEYVAPGDTMSGGATISGGVVLQ